MAGGGEKNARAFLSYVRPGGQWEFDAPQFFDFTRRVTDNDLDTSSEYFDYDHESGADTFTSCASSKNAGVTVDLSLILTLPKSVSCDSHDDTNGANSDEVKTTSLEISVALNSAITPVAVIVPEDNSVSAECVSATVSSDAISSTPGSGNNEQVEHQQFSVKTPEDFNCSTPESTNNKKITLQQARCVDFVTSAKKRLSMSVDRGQARLAKKAAAIASCGALPMPGSPRGLNCRTTRNCFAHGESSDIAAAASPLGDSGFSLLSEESPHILDAEELVKQITRGNLSVVEEERLNRTAAVPHVGIPFNAVVSAAGKRCTVVKPFSFEERNNRMLHHREEYVRRYIEAEAKLRKFHATPFPEIIYNVGPSTGTGCTKSQALTRPIEPRLTATNVKVQKPEVKPKAVSFKAKPAAVVNRAPFVPTRSTQPSTECNVFDLCKEHRAAQRAEWQQRKLERECRRQKQLRQRELELHEANEAEVRRLRKQMIPKAQPLPRYLSQPVQSSRSNSSNGSIATE